MKQTNQKITHNAYEALHNVFRLHYLYSRRFFDKIGIYPGQHTLLTAISQKEGRSQKELADLISVKPATVAVMIRRMEHSGLLYRRPDDGDKRIMHIYLTESGKEKMALLNQVFLRMEKECFQNFALEELEEFTQTLHKIEQNLSDSIYQQNKEL